LSQAKREQARRQVQAAGLHIPGASDGWFLAAVIRTRVRELAAAADALGMARPDDAELVLPAAFLTYWGAVTRRQVVRDVHGGDQKVDVGEDVRRLAAWWFATRLLPPDLGRALIAPSSRSVVERTLPELIDEYDLHSGIDSREPGTNGSPVAVPAARDDVAAEPEHMDDLIVLIQATADLPALGGGAVRAPIGWTGDEQMTAMALAGEEWRPEDLDALARVRGSLTDLGFATGYPEFDTDLLHVLVADAVALLRAGADGLPLPVRFVRTAEGVTDPATGLVVDAGHRMRAPLPPHPHPVPAVLLFVDGGGYLHAAVRLQLGLLASVPAALHQAVAELAEALLDGDDGVRRLVPARVVRELDRLALSRPDLLRALIDGVPARLERIDGEVRDPALRADLRTAELQRLAAAVERFPVPAPPLHPQGAARSRGSGSGRPRHGVHRGALRRGRRRRGAGTACHHDLAGGRAYREQRGRRDGAAGW
jgi:hypothetical protein